jgi:hypothetical protein
MRPRRHADTIRFVPFDARPAGLGFQRLIRATDKHHYTYKWVYLPGHWDCHWVKGHWDCKHH